ncbi:MAG: hypothetical protein QOJ65_1271 [Fimbriimonadaceae bacterium]|nr:hypothetical protein [Fimbriimonadaceae bacterium]
MAAGLIAVLTLCAVQRAFAVTTVPNASRSTYQVVGGSHVDFSLGATDTPVQVMIAGIGRSSDLSNIGFVHVTTLDPVATSWTGVDASGSIKAFSSQGYSGDLKVTEYATYGVRLLCLTARRTLRLENWTAESYPVRVVQIW